MNQGEFLVILSSNSLHLGSKHYSKPQVCVWLSPVSFYCLVTKENTQGTCVCMCACARVDAHVNSPEY